MQTFMCTQNANFVKLWNQKFQSLLFIMQKSWRFEFLKLSKTYDQIIWKNLICCNLYLFFMLQQRICFYTRPGTRKGPILSLDCRYVCVHSMPILDLTTLLFRFTLSVSWEMGFIIWNWSALRFILSHIPNICYIFIIWKKNNMHQTL